jgi:hypothetical protein
LFSVPVKAKGILTFFVGDGARHDLAYAGCFGEDFFLPLVRRKRFALLYAERRQHGEEETVARLDRLGLEYFGEVALIIKTYRVRGSPFLAADG